MNQNLHLITLGVRDFEKSKRFYTEILGFKLDSEVYREERLSYKADLSLNGQYIIELFSFPNPPKRPTKPEATGLRHIAFEVDDVAETLEKVLAKGGQTVGELVHADYADGRKATFVYVTDIEGNILELQNWAE